MQAGFRPAVVIQSNAFNQYSPTTILTPLTTNIKTPFPSEFIIEKSMDNGLESDSRLLGSQIITLDIKYIQKKIGVLEEKYYTPLHQALLISLDLDDIFRL